MSQFILIDTDILIDTSRRVNEAVLCLQQLEQQATLSISVITEMELVIGCRNKKELQILERFLSRFEILDLDKQVSDLALKLLKQYRLSHGLLIADALIASTAIAFNIRLITKNQRDYRFIAGLNVLPYPV